MHLEDSPFAAETGDGLVDARAEDPRPRRLVQLELEKPPCRAPVDVADAVPARRALASPVDELEVPARAVRRNAVRVEIPREREVDRDRVVFEGDVLAVVLMVALPDAPVPVAVVGGVEEACAVRLQLLEEAEVRRVRTRREIALERTAVRRPGLDFPRLRLGNAHEEVDAPVVPVAESPPVRPP